MIINSISKKLIQILAEDEPLTNSEEFIKYWDIWHQTWYRWIKEKCQIENFNGSSNILGWPTPPNSGWRYFPEPYWGNAIDPKAVFLNLNPFVETKKPGEIDFCSKAENSLKNCYDNFKSYNKTIINLGENDSTIYTGGKSWHEERAIWASDILKSKLNVNNILNIDLVPWHTKDENVLKEDILNKINLKKLGKLILNKVIIPAMCISENSSEPFKKKVISRGALIQHLIDGGGSYHGGDIHRFFNNGNIEIKKARYYYTAPEEKSRWHISEVLPNKNKYPMKMLVYIGDDRGMSFPDLKRIFLPHKIDSSQIIFNT